MDAAYTEKQMKDLSTIWDELSIHAASKNMVRAAVKFAEVGQLCRDEARIRKQLAGRWLVIRNGNHYRTKDAS